MRKEEIWKDIEWYEWLYQVSNLWNIKSLSKLIFNWKWYFNSKEKILKVEIVKDWYLRIRLSNNNISERFSIHRLVAETFITNPENKPQVNHINWIKSDNRLKNLEWCTRSENTKHSINILWNKTFLQKQNKNVAKCDSELNIIKIYNSLREVERFFWFKCWSISKVCNWKQKTSYWFIWKFI